MRALTGYDRVILECGDGHAESSRGAFPNVAAASQDCPIMVADIDAARIPVFPRHSEDTSVNAALLCSAERHALDSLREADVRSSLRVPFSGDAIGGEFRCDSRTPRGANFELHAAAELFAQLFAMRLEIDRLRNG